ncbi:hypothetical protein [Stutzerimonas tarimensis]|uniref:DUF2059 domain-containing protein n=1 Tax=Stutzerimonas tarimensis TaxID=1507735 RepID=A0ABV7T525_9GAMM
MRLLALCLLMTASFASVADAYRDLYQTAGWQQQRVHFRDALEAAQQRYQPTLPPAVFNALVANSNQRFAAPAIDQRAMNALRAQLADPQPALTFYRSPLGRKIVAAEVKATRPDEVARHADGVPRLEAGSNRQLLIRHLAQALPASEAGAEVSLALGGVAADSLSQMVPGLLSGAYAQSLLQSQRQRLVQQVEADLDDILLYVYRDLSDPELEEYLEFARSAEGQAYYQAALGALRAGLAVGLSGSELEWDRGI